MNSSESAQLFDGVMADAARKPQLKVSLERIREACNVLEKTKAPIEVRSICEQIFAVHGNRSGPTGGAIRNQKDTLLRYVYLRRF